MEHHDKSKFSKKGYSPSTFFQLISIVQHCQHCRVTVLTLNDLQSSGSFNHFNLHWQLNNSYTRDEVTNRGHSSFVGALEKYLSKYKARSDYAFDSFYGN